jgi:hypothetical protein
MILLEVSLKPGGKEPRISFRRRRPNGQRVLSDIPLSELADERELRELLSVISEELAEVVLRMQALTPQQLQSNLAIQIFAASTATNDPPK